MVLPTQISELKFVSILAVELAVETGVAEAAQGELPYLALSLGNIAPIKSL